MPKTIIPSPEADFVKERDALVAVYKQEFDAAYDRLQNALATVKSRSPNYKNWKRPGWWDTWRNQGLLGLGRRLFHGTNPQDDYPTWKVVNPNKVENAHVSLREYIEVERNSRKLIEEIFVITEAIDLDLQKAVLAFRNDIATIFSQGMAALYVLGRKHGKTPEEMVAEKEPEKPEEGGSGDVVEPSPDGGKDPSKPVDFPKVDDVEAKKKAEEEAARLAAEEEEARKREAEAKARGDAEAADKARLEAEEAERKRKEAESAATSSGDLVDDIDSIEVSGTPEEVTQTLEKLAQDSPSEEYLKNAFRSIDALYGAGNYEEWAKLPVNHRRLYVLREALRRVLEWGGRPEKSIFKHLWDASTVPFLVSKGSNKEALNKLPEQYKVALFIVIQDITSKQPHPIFQPKVTSKDEDFKVAIKKKRDTEAMEYVLRKRLVGNGPQNEYDRLVSLKYNPKLWFKLTQNFPKDIEDAKELLNKKTDPWVWPTKLNDGEAETSLTGLTDLYICYASGDLFGPDDSNPSTAETKGLMARLTDGNYSGSSDILKSLEKVVENLARKGKIKGVDPDDEISVQRETLAHIHVEAEARGKKIIGKQAVSDTDSIVDAVADRKKSGSEAAAKRKARYEELQRKRKEKKDSF